MYGNLILEKFKSNTEDEVIRLNGFRFLSCEGTEYSHFFGNIWLYEVNFQHHSKETIKGQGEVHNLKLTIKQAHIEKSCIFSHEALNIVGEVGLINTIKRMCAEISSQRIDEILGGDNV
ncbi:hypothetical protein Aci011_068 [Acinetobacter phage vB_AbaM_B09_Aci01-1]|uniref:Uncharacterized protein n=1 Tax=Acinetobacter phage vB_AbaM_B09_Aci01-1 TaxID=2315466 RepID=A0A386KIZ7_9CAUD|nr:hypothetical protein HOU29_gp113 [Acinetobacter phage vB_AbaM_B09_Aci01-1]AYD85615.1 hypothetical protein Aci011_068 [Acinetobacter phage vB_AbaM_B09_Aci01-1]